MQEVLMKNEYKTQGDLTIIYLPKRLGGFYETVIDTSDLERANEFPNTWYANFTEEVNSRYVKGSMRVNGLAKKHYLHRWIMKPENKLKVDHINHDTLDNKRSNLRVCTNAQNMWNSDHSPKSKYGVPGIQPIARGLWTSQITVNGENIKLGRFGDKEGAIEARKNAEALYYGDFRSAAEGVPLVINRYYQFVLAYKE
jgi:hypothetical protein